MPSSYNRSDGPPYSRVFPHPAIQHAFPPVSGSVDKQAAFTHPSPHSVQWPPGGSVQKSSSSLDGPSRLSTIYFVSHLKKESENLWPINKTPFLLFLKYLRDTYFDPSAQFNLKLWNHHQQLLTYSDPDCTTNCFESINSGKDCLTLRTPNAVFNKVLKHKRVYCITYAVQFLLSDAFERSMNLSEIILHFSVTIFTSESAAIKRATVIEISSLILITVELCSIYLYKST